MVIYFDDLSNFCRTYKDIYYR